MSFDNKLQRIFSDHIEQMSKDLEKISNGEDNFVFKIYERNLLISICQKVSELFKAEPIVLNLKGDCIVVGDLHGHIIDLYRIFTVFDLPPKTTYLFLGDIVDRGGFSIETITLLFVLKLLYPSNIYIIRGNHEFNMISEIEKEKEKDSQSLKIKHLNSFMDQVFTVYEQKRNQLHPQKNHNNDTSKSHYSFSLHIKSNSNGVASNCDNSNLVPNEDNKIRNGINHSSSLGNDNDTSNKIQMKRNARKAALSSTLKRSIPIVSSKPSTYSDRLYSAFCSAFSYIPLAAMFGKSILCLHGGIGGNFMSIEKDLVPLERPITNYDNAIIENILWSDPMSPEREKDYQNLNFMTSPRGRGCIFGEAPLDAFMKANHLSLLIRAHEVVECGIRLQFNNRLITVFSASSYINSYNNNSGILKISADNKVTTYSFPPFNFLPRESAKFFYSNEKSIVKQPTFSSSVSGYSSIFNSSISITSSIGPNSNYLCNVANNDDLNNDTSSMHHDSNNSSNNTKDFYSIDNFYNIKTNNNISGGNKTNNDKNSVTKIISKTLISYDRKQNFPSNTLYNKDQNHNSTRRRIKFGINNTKRSLAESCHVPTFS